MLDANKIKFIVRVCLFLFMLMFVAVPAFAQDLDLGVDIVGQATGLGGKDTDLRATIGNIIQVALGFLGVVAVVIVLIGGFQYMIAGGSDEKAAKARKWIISGVIGLAIILSAYAITTFVISSLLTATTTGADIGE
ncbi:pilin [Patescibacteria group bacterium]|nr:pilin [Patescibacteria group bacterium]